MDKRRILIAEHDGLVAELRQGPELASTLPRHFHEEFQVILGERRVIRYGIGGQSMVCPTGAIALIPPGEVHTAAVVPSPGMWGDLRTFLVPEISFAALGESGSGRGMLPHSERRFDLVPNYSGFWRPHIEHYRITHKPRLSGIASYYGHWPGCCRLAAPGQDPKSSFGVRRDCFWRAIF